MLQLNKNKINMKRTKRNRDYIYYLNSEEMSLLDIAQKLGINNSTLYSRVKRSGDRKYTETINGYAFIAQTINKTN